MKKTNANLAQLVEQYKNSNLISNLESSLKRELVVSLPLNLIELNQFFDRYFFKEKDLTPLEIANVQSISEPIIVRRNGEKYQVIAGYKRYYFAKKNNYKSIPVIIKNISDDLLLLIVIERIKEDSNENVLNKAYIFENILKNYPISRKHLSKLMEISISQLTNILRLLKLNENVIDCLKKEKITYGQARMLVCLSSSKQDIFLNKILNEKLSVREVEKMVMKKNNKDNGIKNIEIDNNKIIINFIDEKAARKFAKAYRINKTARKI